MGPSAPFSCNARKRDVAVGVGDKNAQKRCNAPRRRKQALEREVASRSTWQLWAINSLACRLSGSRTFVNPSSLSLLSLSDTLFSPPPSSPSSSSCCCSCSTCGWTSSGRIPSLCSPTRISARFFPRTRVVGKEKEGPLDPGERGKGEGEERGIVFSTLAQQYERGGFPKTPAQGIRGLCIGYRYALQGAQLQYCCRCPTYLYCKTRFPTGNRERDRAYHIRAKYSYPSPKQCPPQHCHKLPHFLQSVSPRKKCSGCRRPPGQAEYCVSLKCFSRRARRPLKLRSNAKHTRAQKKNKINVNVPIAPRGIARRSKRCLVLHPPS